MWDISEQAVKTYERAAQHDLPIREAFDRLWAQIGLNPQSAGTPLDTASTTGDVNLRRVVTAIQKLDLMETDPSSGPLEPRITYEPVDGPNMPPPWLVCAIHIPNWPRAGHHTLVTLATVDRKGDATLE